MGLQRVVHDWATEQQQQICLRGSWAWIPPGSQWTISLFPSSLLSEFTVRKGYISLSSHESPAFLPCSRVIHQVMDFLTDAMISFSRNWTMETHAYLPAALWPWASAIPQHQDSMILTPWISLVIQCLSHLLAEMWWHGQFHGEVQFSPNCITKNSSKEGWSRGCQEKVIHTNMRCIQLPLPVKVPRQVGRDVVLTTGPFPNAPLEQDGGNSAQTYHVPTAFYRLPYVQNRSIARCMSKFSF